MTNQDDLMLRAGIRRVADSCTLSPPPVQQLIASATNRPTIANLANNPQRNRVAHRRYLAAFAGLAAAVTLLAGNIATAAAHPTIVPAQPIPPSSTPLSPGTFGAVATLRPSGSTLPRTLWLAADPSGRSQGCVSLTAGEAVPPSNLPNVASESSDPSTFCALPQGSAGNTSLGYEDSFDGAGGQSAGGPIIAFGFVPAPAVRVQISMQKTGIALFRLLDPTTTVTADVYGVALGLPIRAWAGPDRSGFRVTAIKAFDRTGNVVSQLTFGQ